jgi:hypothetical protein
MMAVGGCCTVPLHGLVCTVLLGSCTVQVNLPDEALRTLDLLGLYLAGSDPPAQRVERDAEDGGLSKGERA